MMVTHPRLAICFALLVLADGYVGDRGRHVAKGTKALELEQEEGKDACVVGRFPIEFREGTDFNINEGFGVLRDGSTNLKCHCVDKKCKCYGKGEDCDEYSQLWFYGLAYAHQFGAFFYDLPKYAEQYDLLSMVSWSILGLILFWTGIVVLPHMEIKAVTVQRQRDERKLVQAVEQSQAVRELEDKEAKIMAARGYITMIGAGLVWIGLICQLIPCCQLLRELSFCVEVDDSLCILLVIMNSFVLAACFTLLTLGLVWSDTRGFASLIFLSLCILGVLTIFGGALSVIIWGALTMAALWLYFSYLPSLYQDLKDPDNPNNGSYPRWLQDAGDFAIETELEKFGDTFLCFGQGAV